MLQVIVFLMVFAACMLLIEGVFSGLSIVITLIMGGFWFIIQGLGVLIGVVLAMWLILQVIFG